MNSPLEMVRADLRTFGGYRSARSDVLAGDAWLNANEAPWPNAADAGDALRRYPDPQPEALRVRLAALYGCRADQLLAGRGSDEGIDLLVRALCAPGQGAVLVTSPTFGMYAVSARLHGVEVVDVPLRDGASGFACDFDGVADAALATGARVVFLCSPGNPVGSLLPLAGIDALAATLDGHAIVVVDEAYQEYAGAPSATGLLATRRNVAVLRTLSKAHALAGARIGSVIADADLIAVLQRCQAPYPLPAPCVEAALKALSDDAQGETQVRITNVIGERARLAARLSALAGVRRVHPSSANFVLVRFEDAQAAFDALLAAGIVVRDMRQHPQLADALRITIGTPVQNDGVVRALAAMAMPA